MSDTRLIKVGGYFALIVAVMQIIGNGLHPPIPTVTIEALELIAGTSYWVPIHVLITVSYFMFIPFIVGASAAFKDRKSPLVRIGTVLVIVGAGIGAVQISTHLTLFKYLSDQYIATSDSALQQMIVFTYESFWPWNVALEVAHLVAIFVAAFMFGVAILQEDVFPRWLGNLGVASGAVSTAGILIGKIVMNSRTGDIVFGVGLLPLVIWIIAIGVLLLRLKTAPEPLM
jgi:hypothetical protein